MTTQNGNTSSPLIVTIPHSGEKVPLQTPWLNSLPEEILMCDVDRFVDVLYEPALRRLQIPFVKTEWHRYAADLNRIPDDVDASSVWGHSTPAGKHSRGFHWVITTYKHQLMKEPMSVQAHQELVDLIYKPFHQDIQKLYENLRLQGFQKTFHIDAHSMPSVGTQEHRDPGQRRAEIVISDCSGQSCSSQFRDLVVTAYTLAGFKVACNWPYLGGRVTEVYGKPQQEQHAIQVEMNRDLYMNEVTKKLKPEAAKEVQDKVMKALEYVQKNIANL